VIVTDSTFWIDLAEERQAGGRGPAATLLARHHAEPLGISIVTWGELAVGFEQFSQLTALFGRVTIISLRQTIAWEASRIERTLRATGQPLGENDNWIAATARIYGLQLVTNDQAFRRVPRLRLLHY
jgi:predicted nucleic acid-binding protein